MISSIMKAHLVWVINRNRGADCHMQLCGWVPPASVLENLASQHAPVGTRLYFQHGFSVFVLRSAPRPPARPEPRAVAFPRWAALAADIYTRVSHITLAYVIYSTYLYFCMRHGDTSYVTSYDYMMCLDACFLVRHAIIHKVPPAPIITTPNSVA